MMDDFEKHIRDNKVAFDEHKVDRARLWANITSKLDDNTVKVVPLWKSPLLRIVATVVILLGIGAFIGLSIFGGNYNTEDRFASQELMDIDMHYRNLVSHQVQLLQNNPKLSDSEKEEFLSFMDELDEEYDVLRLDMQENLDNELVLEAIITNYKKRIELIENLLKQINNSKLKDDNYGYTL
ncbi:hypothetical protein [Kriegella aquimaris]|uniref:Anti-sigma factor n=1 Tax=Kriegella aquimaris TaxID=192904 RepID=A0A1G9IW34_9FLAO|nr:hypothetical protein [Kriegella aquimaris]SDL29390.1 hypothetical protein SAMN04488514_101304 [Kriegella aquimaris]